MEDLTKLVAALATLVVALTGLCSILVPFIIKLWYRDRVTDARVDVLWKAQASRGRAEMKSKGLVIETPNTPPTKEEVMGLAVKPEVRAAFAPIAPGLRDLRKKLGPNVTEGQLVEAIETKYGDWLSVHICPVLGVNDFACLSLAGILASEPVSDASVTPDVAVAATPPK